MRRVVVVQESEDIDREGKLSRAYIVRECVGIKKVRSIGC
jgi:hypothetical protein